MSIPNSQSISHSTALFMSFETLTIHMHCFKIVVILKARENRVHMYKKKGKKNPILIIQRPDLQVSKVSRVGQIFKL